MEEALLGSLRLGGPCLLSRALKAQQARPVSAKGLLPWLEGRFVSEPCSSAVGCRCHKQLASALWAPVWALVLALEVVAAVAVHPSSSRLPGAPSFLLPS